MRGKLILGVALAALVAASLAVASPPAGKGKPEGAGKAEGKAKSTTGDGCRPAVQVVLKGTLVGAPGSGTSMTVAVKSGNKHAKVWVSGSQPVTIQLTTDTKVRRQGQKTAADLVSGDRVLVQARVCKADLTGSVLPPLKATKVIAHPAGDAAKKDDAKKDSETKDDDQD